MQLFSNMGFAVEISKWNGDVPKYSICPLFFKWAFHKLGFSNATARGLLCWDRMMCAGTMDAKYKSWISDSHANLPVHSASDFTKKIRVKVGRVSSIWTSESSRYLKRGNPRARARVAWTSFRSGDWYGGLDFKPVTKPGRTAPNIFRSLDQVPSTAQHNHH